MSFLSDVPGERATSTALSVPVKQALESTTDDTISAKKARVEVESAETLGLDLFQITSYSEKETVGLFPASGAPPPPRTSLLREERLSNKISAFKTSSCESGRRIQLCSWPVRVFQRQWKASYRSTMKSMISILGVMLDVTTRGFTSNSITRKV